MRWRKTALASLCQIFDSVELFKRGQGSLCRPLAIFLGRSILRVIFGISAMLDETIKCVLGPTNTGKTFYAVDRMLGHASGMIGFPLRLLARENYDKIVARIGASQVALLTG